MLRPKVFIGSSREGLRIAQAVHSNLMIAAECTVWNSGTFQIGMTYIDSINQELHKSDFGIFILSPDDITIIRNNESKTARDNVIFELGMFIGHLGRERCFFMRPHDAANLHLPSDLDGITAGVYENARRDGKWETAVSPACVEISTRISSLTHAPAAPQPSGTAPKTITIQFHGNGLLVKGDTRPYREEFLKLKAAWNKSLNGWILAKNQLDDLKKALPHAVEV